MLTTGDIPWELFVIAAMANAGVTLTLTRAKITRPMREWVGRVSPWLGSLVSCPYCVSHWGALIVTLLTTLRLLGVTDWLDLPVTVFALVTATTLLTGTMQRLTLLHDAEIERLSDLLATTRDLLSTVAAHDAPPTLSRTGDQYDT